MNIPETWHDKSPSQINHCRAAVCGTTTLANRHDVVTFNADRGTCYHIAADNTNNIGACESKGGR